MKTSATDTSPPLEPPRETRKRHKLERIELCVILGLGAILFLPAVRAPLFLDDFLQGAMVEGTFPAPRGVFDLYDFVDDHNRAQLMQRGLLPWWTDARLTLRFFRPLSSALLFLDHKLTSHAALPMHLHSLAWWVAASLAARALFLRVLPARGSTTPGVCGGPGDPARASHGARFATAVFALAPCHALPLAWLANREVLVALTFGALGLARLAGFRDSSRPRDGLVAALLFVLALLGGGEYALCFGGYVIAMDLVRREGIGRRVLGWAPFAVPAAAYLAARAVLRYGAAGSGFYSDPLRDPVAFLTQAPMRFVSLVASGWLSVDVEWWRFGVARWGLLALVAVSAFVAVPTLSFVLRHEDEVTRRSARWLLFGSLLSLVPVLAVVPARRLLGVSMLGVAAVVGLVLARAWFPGGEGEEAAEGADASSLARLVGLVALGLGFAHLVHGPGTSWLASRTHRADGEDFGARVRFLERELAASGKREIGVLRGLSGAFFVPFALDARGAAPPRWGVLSHAGHVLALRRDERTMDLVTSPDRGLFPAGERNLYRAPDAKMRAGRAISVPGMKVTILEAGEAGPRSARFEFDEPPTDRLWVTDDYEDVRLVPLPAIGFGVPLDPRGDRSASK